MSVPELPYTLEQLQAAAAAIVASNNYIQTVHSGAEPVPCGQTQPVHRAEGTRDAVEAAGLDIDNQRFDLKYCAL